MTCGVYAIRNTISGRVYIGSSVKIEKRWSLHRHQLRAGTHHSRILQSSWNKHGEQAFAFDILLVVPVDALIDHEQLLIDQLRPSFNIHQQARSALGVKRSAETKDKLSQAKNGKPNPSVADSNRRRRGEKKPHSPQHAAAISQAKRGKPNLKNRGVKKPWLAERNRLMGGKPAPRARRQGSRRWLRDQRQVFGWPIKT